uniref:Uncharacterized protein n=1 Tax=Octopus bimaculoides TaxID=37653 RepID=A0A0L8IE92_OCTBM
MKKPKIKWPKANDAASYKKFDDEVVRMTTKFKGDDEQKLENLVNIIYREGEKRYGLEATGNGESSAKGGPSRREIRIAKIRKEKKHLRTRWRDAKGVEREDPKQLHEEIKKRHRDQLRKEEGRTEKKKREKNYCSFVNNLYQYAKRFFTESKSGRRARTQS